MLHTVYFTFEYRWITCFETEQKIITNFHETMKPIRKLQHPARDRDLTKRGTCRPAVTSTPLCCRIVFSITPTPLPWHLVFSTFTSHQFLQFNSKDTPTSERVPNVSRVWIRWLRTNFDYFYQIFILVYFLWGTKMPEVRKYVMFWNHST